ncbi:MAG: DUF5672 family protein [Cytophagaceae bacterium]
MKKKCVVVIPIHSSNPSDFELISFAQCFKVIKSAPIVVMHPKSLDLRRYRAVVDEFETISIPPEKMSSLLNYNKLKLSRFFYRFFLNYEYILTYELDAFIFKDDIEYWCSLDIDYIGAPWLKKVGDSISFNGVGNSGFSLRRVSVLDEFIKKYIRYPNSEPEKLIHRVYNKFIMVSYRLFPFKENITLQKWCLQNEDFVISVYGPQVLPDFKIASYMQATKFSFECYPDYMYMQNSFMLPMGCHAWWRYNLTFWKPFIEKEGYRL